MSTTGGSLIPISQLIAPAPSGVNAANPSAAPVTGSWLNQLLAIAQQLGLLTTAWQPGGVARTILSIAATALAQEDAVVSMMAQGGFLDYAATGTVTTTSANGVTVTQPVTPDPSIPSQNATGALGWLDALADSVYNVQRIGATQASNLLAIANTSASTYGPFAAGTYHVSNPTTGAGYSNAGSLTIAAANLVGGGITAATNTSPITITTSSAHGLTSSNVVFISGVTGNTNANGFWAITVVDTTHFILNGSSGNGSYVSGGTVNVCTTATFIADLSGPSGTSVPGGITSTTTTLSGVSVSNVAAFFGQQWESNTALSARCRAKLQSLSPGGPAGAYKYFALSASQILAAQTPPVQLSSAITRVLVQTSATSGVVTTTIANAGGAVSGVSNLGIAGATNATPIVVQTTASHGLSTGAYVTISGVIGNTNANGTWVVTVVDATHFSLNGSTGNSAYVSGGVVEGGDLGEVDTVIQANAVADNVTAITQSATNFNVAIVGTVTVPQAQVSIYTAAVQTALTAYFAGLPIGGVGSGVLNYGDIVGILYQAGSVNGLPSYVVSVSGVTVNSGTVDVSYPAANYVAALSPTPAITVLGV